MSERPRLRSENARNIRKHSRPCLHSTNNWLSDHNANLNFARSRLATRRKLCVRLAGTQLPIDLTKHDVEAAQDGGDVGQHVPAVHEIRGLEVGEAGGADLAAVGAVAAVGDEIDSAL